MKKGFTMIELIFVIVILGILASVAIPRLAATRADAEISAAIANMRTLLSDAAAFEVTNGSFQKATTTNGTTTTAVVAYSAITNVALVDSSGAKISGTLPITTEAYIPAGGKPCIGVSIVEKVTTTDPIKPAYLKLTTGVTGKAGVCDQVTAAESVKAFTEHVITPATDTAAAIKGIAIGSDTEVYKSTSTN